MVNTSKQTELVVWDVLLRVFHWSLVVLFFTAFLTEDDLETVHFYAGYGILGLLTFRLAWGIVGSKYARFSNFVCRPKTVKKYLQSLTSGEPKHYVGHNPAGGMMVILLIVTLIVTCLTGVLMIAGEGEGPLAAYYVAGSWWFSEAWLEPVHELMANTVMFMVVVHVVGVLVSSVLHQENLIKAMLTGKKKRL